MLIRGKLNQVLASKSLSQAQEIVAECSLTIKSSVAKELQVVSDKATLS
jgi:hypothetical protein